jgi:thiamine-monophosphate kinase
LWVTGLLGGAAAAVQAWNAGLAPAAAARAAFARPEPRLGPAVWLAEHGLASALIDLSDGLAGDVGHLAAASGACAVLELAQVPVHPAALEAAPGADAALRLALAGGEDYELCFASAAGAMEQHVPAFVERFNLRVTRVGTIRAGSGVVAIAASGSERKLESGGFSHFA